MEQREDDKEIMELALQAGHILLENGAEIFRVEETMDRICPPLRPGIREAHLCSAMEYLQRQGTKRSIFFAKVQHIPVSGGASGSG